MNKKRIYLLIIAVILIGTLATAGSFAFWQWTSDTNTSIRFNTGVDLTDSIVYDSGESTWAGDFQVGTMCAGIHNTVSFYKTEDAPIGEYYATINMDVNSIGANIALRRGVKWAITEGDSSSCGTPLRQGNFLGTTDGDTLELYNSIPVTTTAKKYTVWMWIDGTENPSYLLSGETIDTSVWTEIDMNAEEKFEITNINANYQEIDVSVINTKNNITHYAITTNTTAPSSWTSISSPAKYYNLQYTATNSGGYYFWFKDSSGATVTTAKSTTITTGGTSSTIPSTQTVVTKDSVGPECTWEYYPAITNGTWSNVTHAYYQDATAHNGTGTVGIVTNDQYQNTVMNIEYTKTDSGHILLTCRDTGVGLGTFQNLTAANFTIYRRDLNATVGEGSLYDPGNATRLIKITSITGSAITLPTSNPNYQGGVNTEAWQYKINLSGSTYNGQMSLLLNASALKDKANNGNAASAKSPWIFVNKIAPELVCDNSSYDGSSHKLAHSSSTSSTLMFDNEIYAGVGCTAQCATDCNHSCACISSSTISNGKTYTVIEGVNAATYTISATPAIGYVWLQNGTYTDAAKSCSATISPATPTISSDKGIGVVSKNYCLKKSGTVVTSTTTLTSNQYTGSFVVSVKPPIQYGTVTNTGVVTNYINGGTINPFSRNTGTATISGTNPSTFSGSTITYTNPGNSTITFTPVTKGSPTLGATFNSCDRNYVNNSVTNVSGVFQTSATNVVYDGQQHCLVINGPVTGATIVSASSALTTNSAANTNYNLICGTNADTYVATYTINANGYEGFNGTANIEIIPKCIKDSDVSLSQEYATIVYNNTELRPNVTLTYAGMTLLENRDYTITWPADVTNIGTKTATITGIGNYDCGSNTCYSGTKTRTFSYTITKASPTIKIVPVVPVGTPAINPPPSSATTLIPTGTDIFACDVYNLNEPNSVGNYTAIVHAPYANETLAGTLSVVSDATYVIAKSTFTPSNTLTGITTSGATSTNTFTGKYSTADSPATIAISVTFTPVSTNYKEITATLLVGTVSRSDPLTSLTGTSGTPYYKQKINATVTTRSHGNRIFKWYVSDSANGSNPTLLSSATLGNGTNTHSYTVGSGIADKHLFVVVDVLKDTCYKDTSSTFFFGTNGGVTPNPIVKIANPTSIGGKTVTYNADYQNLWVATNVPIGEVDDPEIIKYIVDMNGAAISSNPFSGTNCATSYSNVETASISAASMTFGPKLLAGTYNMWWCIPEKTNYYAKSGTAKVVSVINRYNISSGTPLLSCSTYTYSGNTYTPSASLVVPIPSGNSLTLRDNFSNFQELKAWQNKYAYSNNTDAGTGTVTFTSPATTSTISFTENPAIMTSPATVISNYTGTVTKTFTINKLTPNISFTGGGLVTDGGVATNISTASISSIPYGSCLYTQYSSVLPSTVSNCSIASNVVGTENILYSTSASISFPGSTTGNTIYLKRLDTVSQGNISASSSKTWWTQHYIHTGRLIGPSTITTKIMPQGSGGTGEKNYNSASTSFIVGSVSQGTLSAITLLKDSTNVIDVSIPVGATFTGIAPNIISAYGTNSCDLREDKTTLMNDFTYEFYVGQNCNSSSLTTNDPAKGYAATTGGTPVTYGLYSFRAFYNRNNSATLDYSSASSSCGILAISQKTPAPISFTEYNGTIDCGSAFNPTFSATYYSGTTTSPATLTYGTVTTAAGAVVNNVSNTKIINYSGATAGTLDGLGWNTHQTGTYYVKYSVTSQNYVQTSGSVRVVIKPKPLNVCTAGYISNSYNRTKVYDRTTNLPAAISITTNHSDAISSSNNMICDSHWPQLGITHSSAAYNSKTAGTNKNIVVSGISYTSLATLQNTYSLSNTSCTYSGTNGGTITRKPLILENGSPILNSLQCKPDGGNCMKLVTESPAATYTVYDYGSKGCFGYNGLAKYYDGSTQTLTIPAAHGGIVYGAYDIVPIIGTSSEGYSCVISGDTVTATYVHNSNNYSGYDGPLASATHTIYNSSVTLAGTDAENYCLANQTGVCDTASSSTVYPGAIVKRKNLCDYVTVQNDSSTYDCLTNHNSHLGINGAGLTGATLYMGTSNGLYTFSVPVETRSQSYALSPSATYVGPMTRDAGTYVFYWKVTAPNYEDCVGSATTTIAKRPLIPSVSASKTKGYDCTTVIPGSPTLSVNVSSSGATSGLCGGQTVTIGYSNATFDSKNAGSRNVVVSGITISGNSASNYTLTRTSATTTGGSISKYPVTPSTLTHSPSTKTYDCTSNAPSGFKITNIKKPSTNVNGGAVSCGDTVNATFTDAHYQTYDGLHSANAVSWNGTSAALGIYVSGVSLTGADAGNYYLTSTSGYMANGSINKYTPTITLTTPSATIPFWSDTVNYSFKYTMPASCSGSIYSNGNNGTIRTITEGPNNYGLSYNNQRNVWEVLYQASSSGGGTWSGQYGVVGHYYVPGNDAWIEVTTGTADKNINSATKTASITHSRREILMTGNTDITSLDIYYHDFGIIAYNMYNEYFGGYSPEAAFGYNNPSGSYSLSSSGGIKFDDDKVSLPSSYSGFVKSSTGSGTGYYSIVRRVLGDAAGSYSGTLKVGGYGSCTSTDGLGNYYSGGCSTYFSPSTRTFSVVVRPIPFNGATRTSSTVNGKFTSPATIEKVKLTRLQSNGVSGTGQNYGSGTETTYQYTGTTHYLFKNDNSAAQGDAHFALYLIYNRTSTYGETFRLDNSNTNGFYATNEIQSITDVPTTNCVTISGDLHRCSTVITLYGVGGFSGTTQIKVNMDQSRPTIAADCYNQTYNGSARTCRSVTTGTVQSITAGVNSGQSNYYRNMPVSLTSSYTYYKGTNCSTLTTAANSGAASSGAAPVWVGTYSAKAVSATTRNLGSATSACVSFTVGCKTLTIGTDIIVGGDITTYDGQQHSATIKTNVAGLNISSGSVYSGDTSHVSLLLNPLNNASIGTIQNLGSREHAGTTTFGASITSQNGNYCATNVTAMVKVGKKTLSISSAGCPSATYRGSSASYTGSTVSTGVNTTTGTMIYKLVTSLGSSITNIAGTGDGANVTYAGQYATSSGSKQVGWLYYPYGGAGTYKVSASFAPESSGNYSGVANTITCTVGKATLPAGSVTITTVTKTYNCSSYSPTITVNAPGSTIVSGLSTSYGNSVISGGTRGALKPAYSAAGTYNYYYKITGPNYNDYTSSYSGALTITKATPNVTVSSKTATYTGSAITTTSSMSVTGCSASAATTIYYSSSVCSGATIAAPIAAGTYGVKGTAATTTNTNSATSSCGTLAIKKAPITVSVGNYNSTYDGSAHSASIAVTSMAGATVYYSTANYGDRVISYPNWFTATSKGTWYTLSNYSRSDVGTTIIYYAVAYSDNYEIKTGSVTISITNAAFNVTASSVNATYDGTTRYAKITLSNADSATIKYGTTSSYGYTVTTGNRGTATSLTSLGTAGTVSRYIYYQISKANYTTVSGSVYFKISPATFSYSTGSVNKTYDGASATATIKVTNVTGVKISYTSSVSTSTPTTYGSSTTTSSNTNYSLYTSSATYNGYIHFKLEKTNYQTVTGYIRFLISPAAISYSTIGCSATQPSTCQPKVVINTSGVKLESGNSTSYGNTIVTSSSSGSTYSLLPAATTVGTNYRYFKLTRANYTTVTSYVSGTVVGTIGVNANDGCTVLNSSTAGSPTIKVTVPSGATIRYSTNSSGACNGTTLTSNSSTTTTYYFPAHAKGSLGTTTYYYCVSSSGYNQKTGSVRAITAMTCNYIN